MTTQPRPLPTAIYIYLEGRSKSLDPNHILSYVQRKFKGPTAEIRGAPFTGYVQGLAEEERERTLEDVARKLARLRVRDPNQRNVEAEPLHGEVTFEKRYLTQPDKKPIGIVYDGCGLKDLYFEWLPERERTENHLHLVITNQLFGTFSREDRRYHLRTSVYGFPSLISTSGLVEAPARPREYYLRRQMGIDPAILDEELKSRCLHRDDDRLTEVLKGYVMQALFFHLTGNPFCTDKTCRLFNAHWQEELLIAQLSGEPELCPHHQKIVDEITKNGRP